MSDTRREQVEQRMAILRRHYDRLRDVSLPAARDERETLERELVKLRAELRDLDAERRGPRCVTE